MGKESHSLYSRVLVAREEITPRVSQIASGTVVIQKLHAGSLVSNNNNNNTNPDECRRKRRREEFCAGKDLAQKSPNATYLVAYLFTYLPLKALILIGYNNRSGA